MADMIEGIVKEKTKLEIPDLDTPETQIRQLSLGLNEDFALTINNTESKQCSLCVFCLDTMQTKYRRENVNSAIFDWDSDYLIIA
jgi:hypothetical protein